MNKDLKKFFRELRRQGFVVEQTKNGHYKATHPDHPSKIVYIGGTASDPRAIKNALARLRQMGFRWGGR